MHRVEVTCAEDLVEGMSEHCWSWC